MRSLVDHRDDTCRRRGGTDNLQRKHGNCEAGDRQRVEVGELFQMAVFPISSDQMGFPKQLRIIRFFRSANEMRQWQIPAPLVNINRLRRLSFAGGSVVPGRVDVRRGMNAHLLDCVIRPTGEALWVEAKRKSQ
jgi:hypothetical protein